MIKRSSEYKFSNILSSYYTYLSDLYIYININKMKLVQNESLLKSTIKKFKFYCDEIYSCISNTFKCYRKNLKWNDDSVNIPFRIRFYMDCCIKLISKIKAYFKIFEDSNSQQDVFYFVFNKIF